MTGMALTCVKLITKIVKIAIFTKLGGKYASFFIFFFLSDFLFTTCEDEPI